MSEEILRLCTKFEELRASDYIEFRGCDCGATHRGILIKRCDDEAHCDFKEVVDKRGWFYTPGGGHNRTTTYSWFSADAVTKRLIYIVETGVNSEDYDRKTANNEHTILPEIECWTEYIWMPRFLRHLEKPERFK